MNNKQFKQLKYYKARLAIMTAIAESGLKVGDRVPSLRKLAASLPYGAITISRALTDMQNDGLLESRHGSGTYLARELKNGSFQNNILFINVGRRDQNGTGPHEDVLRNYLAENGVGLNPLFVYEFGLDIIEAAKNSIAILLTGWLTPEFLHQMHSIHQPMMIIGNYRENDSIPSVSLDFEQGSYRLTKQFIKEGKKRVALFSTVSEEYYTSICYHAGYAKALAEHGLPQNILNMDDFLGNDPAFRHSMNSNPPEAILMEPHWFYNFSAWCLDNQYHPAPSIGIFFTPLNYRVYRQSANFRWVVYEDLYLTAARLLLNHMAKDTALESMVIEPFIPGIDNDELTFTY